MRTPTMNTATAEAALGVRGATAVTQENKALFHKWLTSRGVNGAYAQRCYMWLANKVYNDTTDGEFNTYKAKHDVYFAEKRQEDGERKQEYEDKKQEESPIPAPAPAPAPIESTPSNPVAVNDAGKALADLVGPYIGAAVEEAVMAKVDARLATVQIIRHEIVLGAETRTIEGVAHKALPRVIDAIAANVPTLLIGPAGGGKSTAAEQCAKALDMRFYLQGAASGTHEYLGYKDGAGQYHATPFRQAFEHGGLFCAEELDSGDAAVPLILNAGLANGHMAFPDSVEPIKRHADFRIIANANTYGNGADRIYVGRTQLDGATIDRFCFLDWNYDESLERAIAGNDKWVDRVQALRKAAVEEKARIIISPRASIFGARMLARNWPLFDVEEAFVWKGTDKELRRRIETRAAGF